MRDYKKEVTSTKSQKHGLELCWLLGNMLKGWNTAELQTNICSENWSETCEREVRESLWRQKCIKTREWDNECVTWSSEHCKAITSLSSLINVQSFKSRNKTCRLRIERWALRPTCEKQKHRENHVLWESGTFTAVTKKRHKSNARISRDTSQKEGPGFLEHTWIHVFDTTAQAQRKLSFHLYFCCGLWRSL